MQDVLIDLISDPFDGPFYGEDWSIDDNGFVQVSDIKVASLILRKVNQSQVFDQKFVRLGQTGDVYLLGFDTLLEQDPVYTATIGPEKVSVEIKEDQSKKYCIYIDGKRSSRMFAKLLAAKKYIKLLEKEMQDVVEINEPIDD